MGKVGAIVDAVGVYRDIRQTKRWYASKTIWYNLLLALLNLASAFQISFINDFLARTGLSHDDITNISVALAVVGNIILRFITSEPVSLRSQAGTGGTDQTGQKAGRGATDIPPFYRDPVVDSVQDQRNNDEQPKFDVGGDCR